MSAPIPWVAKTEDDNPIHSNKSKPVTGKMLVNFLFIGLQSILASISTHILEARCFLVFSTSIPATNKNEIHNGKRTIVNQILIPSGH